MKKRPLFKHVFDQSSQEIARPQAARLLRDARRKGVLTRDPACRGIYHIHFGLGLSSTLNTVDEVHWDSDLYPEEGYTTG